MIGKNFLALILIFVLTAAFLETGFSVRSWLSERRQKESFSEEKRRVLFIGDSILGFLDQKNNSISHEIAKKIEQQFPKKYEFKEFSIPAITTDTILSSIHTEMEYFQPHIVIFLAGKSDFIQNMMWSDNFLSKLRTFRLLQAAYLDLRFKWTRLINSKYQAWEDMQSGWDFFGRSQCAQALPFFEKSILAGLDFNRILRGLHYCYISEKQSERALVFFNEIKNRTLHKDLVNDFISIHQYLKNPQDSSYKVLDKPKSRDRARTQLWFYRELQRPKDFYRVYSQMSPHITDRLFPRSAQNIKAILDIIRSYGSTILMLQYPMDHIENLKVSLRDNSKDIVYVDLRSALIKVPAQQLITMWRDDIDHLNTAGCMVAADAVIENLLLKFKEIK